MPSSFGEVHVRMSRPQGAPGMLPAIVYMHGGGWVLGNAGTHDRLARELAVGSNAALCLSSTPTRPRRATRWRSSRVTPPRSGSPAKAPRRAWTRAASR